MSQPIKVYSTTWCSDCTAAKAVLRSMQVPFENIDIDEMPDAVSIVLELNKGNRTVPTILFPDGSFLSEPTITELRRKLSSLP